jgi:hypothetical protein
MSGLRLRARQTWEERDVAGVTMLRAAARTQVPLFVLDGVVQREGDRSVRGRHRGKAPAATLAPLFM